MKIRLGISMILAVACAAPVVQLAPLPVTVTAVNVTVSPPGPLTVESGKSLAFTVTPSPGFTLDSVVGGTCPPGVWSAPVYTTGAIFSSCSVSFSGSPILLTVTPSGDGSETIAPSAPQSVAEGSTQKFTVTASTGYLLTTAVGGTCPAGSWTSGSTVFGEYTTGPITASCSVFFGATLDTFQVSASGDSLETITPSGPQAVAGGDMVSFTVVADPGYAVSPTVGGTCPSGAWSGAVYTTGPIEAACTVSFSATLGAFQVTATGDSFESIAPSTQAVSDGSTATFTVTADGGYALSTVIGGTCPAGSWFGAVYTTGPIVAACTVSFSATLEIFQVTATGDSFESILPPTQAVSDGSTATFTVTANGGYALSTAVGGTCPNGAWSGAVYTTAAITGACTVSFSTSPNPYPVTASGDGGEVIEPSSQTVDYGTTAVFVVTAAVGGTVSPAVGGTCPAGSWSGSSYTTGPIVGACTVSFSAIPDTFPVTASGDGWEAIGPAASQTVDYGTAAVFTVTAEPGYSLSTAVGGTCPTGFWSGDAYTTGVVTSACTVSFNALPNTYSVIATGDTCESIGPSASQTVDYGTTAAFTVTPATGCTLSPAVGGTCPAGAWNGSSYTTGAIVGACTVSFTSTVTTYPVVAAGDTDESIEPSTSQSVPYQGAAVFTVTANAGYTLTASVGGTCPNGAWSGAVYTTGPIVAACTVSFGASANIYPVTASGDGEEAIDPGAVQEVAFGEVAAFTVTAATGYMLSTAVGGTCPAGSWSGNVYSTGAINGACTVSFGATAIIYPVTASGDGEETIDPGAVQDVAFGEVAAFTVTAATGYTLTTAVGGTCPPGSWSGSVYSTGAINGACTVSFGAAVTNLASCADILSSMPGAPDGLYTITPDGNDPITVWCDMTTGGGGWTVFYAGLNGSPNDFAQFENTAADCPDPENECLRRLPESVPSTVTIAATCGSAALSFQVTEANFTYLQQGVLGGQWQPLSNVTALTGGTDTSVAQDMWAGEEGNPGWIIGAPTGSCSAAVSFADSYDQNTCWDYCNGLSDQSSPIRLMYR